MKPKVNRDDLIRELAERGLSKKMIARSLKLSINTVRRVLRSEPNIEKASRRDKKHIPLEILLTTHARCEGWAERTHEELTKAGYRIGYSTLTRLIRDTVSPKGRKKIAMSHKDVPGEEFQHDTSPVHVTIGNHSMMLQVSSLYYRFSKIIFILFYPYFTRFELMCFLDEAIKFVGYICDQMIVDNTSLVVLRGTGPDAVMVPEMEAFAQSLDFIFVAHELGHSDRKGGVEKSIRTVQTNFLPGRQFTSLDDLNQQARQWCLERMKKKTAHGIPQELLAMEKPFLKPRPDGLVPPYRSLTRLSDQYGFVAYKANFYWAGRAGVMLDVFVFAETIVLYQGKKQLYEYQLAPYDAKGKKISPPDFAHRSINPHKGNNAKRVETELRSLSPAIAKYLDASYGQFRTHRSRQAFVRSLEELHSHVSQDLFIGVLDKAQQHEIFDTNGVRRLIALELKRQKLTPRPIVKPQVEKFEHREAYQRLKKSKAPDLSQFHKRISHPKKKEKHEKD